MTKQTTASGLDLGSIGLRERIARHVATGGVASNFDAVCAKLERRRSSAQIECPACDGLGFRMFSAAELAVYTQRLAKMQANGASWETLDAERWRLNRDSVCGTCRGACYIPNADYDPDPPPDSMFTTVTCPACRGSMKTANFGRWRGSSCGEIFPPTDATAEHGDACPQCLGEAYIVKHVARPVTKSREITRYAEELEDVPVRLRSRGETDPETGEAGEVLADFEEKDPMVAAAMVALLGPQGDKWAQHQWGRRFAIWPLTEAGQRLVEEADFASAELDAYLRALDTLQGERLAEIEAEVGRPRRRALLGLADSQAKTLENRVDRAIREAEAA